MYILYFIYGKYWSNLFSIFDDVILVYFSCVLIHTCTWAFILGTSFWWLFMSKGNYGYYQKVHKILFMPSSIMFMLKCNSIHYHREHKKRLLPISNYDFTLMLISDLIKIYVKVGSPIFSIFTIRKRKISKKNATKLIHKFFWPRLLKNTSVPLQITIKLPLRISLNEME